MTFHLAILCLMAAAIAGTIADWLYIAIRKAWRRHMELRSIARTARLCRLYGFCAPHDDPRDWLSQFKDSLR